MSDFFREVDEELRNDRMKAAWKKYGKIAIGVAVLLIAATAGYRYYLHWQEQKAGAAGDQYLQALDLANDGDRAGARKIFDQLAQDGWGGYPILAGLRSATTLIADGKSQEGIDALDALSKNSALSGDLQDYAKVQAAMAAVDLESYDQITARTEGLLDDDNAWRNFAREARALSAWKAGDLDEAAKWVQELKSNNELPQGMRARIQIIEDLIISRGGKLPSTSDS
ncbi:MAG: tetratricopeptide repeat protein [Hyphomicrobiales bacterium]